ncbi:ROK family transcriptional regulator [Sphingomonas phyllosphaerae]|uniref:ROK family transcriptional regulator n=1 Tax=Sphingomonas phyllosphaerae TaxID=257003 RepID=UPI0003B64206|nr:ROK family transcriptional regulator [Sphingomonas phyllosphaerae]
MGAIVISARARTVLATIRRHGAASRAALIRESGLSGTAIFRATEELEAAGLVRTGDPVASGRGQPSHLIHIVPDAAFALGLSVMTDRADVVLLDLAGRVRAQREITVAGMPRAALLDAAVAFGTAALQPLGIPPGRLKGMGIAVAGYFVAPGTVNPGEELNDWALVDLHAAAARQLALPVAIENIASAAALGERLLGSGARYASSCYVNVAGGFGAGVIVDGVLLRGYHGNAGEVAGLFPLAGRVTPNLATLRHCLDDHGVATAGIADMIARFDPAWPGIETWLEQHQPSFSYLFGALRYTLDCEAIILGGRLPRVLAQRIVAAVDWPEAQLPARRERRAPMTKLDVAVLEPELAGPLGAAALVFHRTLFD